MKILGIDPGTGICGFGVVEITKASRPLAIDFGVIATPPHTPLPERLEDIYNSMNEIIEQDKPDLVSIEKLFFSKNITTGISVAEARGICLLTAKQHNLPMYEYTPNEIKKTLTGYGSAGKKQVQEMVRIQLGLKEVPKPDDAADALAAAITHLLTSRVDLLADSPHRLN